VIDVLIVSLGSTAGLRAVEDELLGALRRAGARAEIARARPPRPVRTLMLTDLAWALAARSAARQALAREPARALVYSTSTAALLWPRRGAIRFDALAAANRPGRHGLWQRPLERLRLGQATLLMPQSAAALQELPPRSRERWSPSLVVPVPVEPSGERRGERDIAAITYAANPHKKGLDLVLAAWASAHRPGEQLIVAGVEGPALDAFAAGARLDGVRAVGALAAADYRALLRRSRVYVCAARREDYGIAQLEALVDGCVLVSLPSPGPYAALALARELDARLVGEDLGAMVRIALDDPSPGYAERALEALAPFRRAAVDRLVAQELLPRLLGSAAPGAAPGFLA